LILITHFSHKRLCGGKVFAVSRQEKKMCCVWVHLLLVCFG